jgi:hypothetical protein
MATKTQINYTPEQTLEIVQLFTSGTAVEQIAEQFGKTTRSIIAKLSREGVYVAKSKAAGTKRMTKLDMIAKVEEALELDQVLSSMEKASYEAVEALYKAVVR